MSTAQEYLEKDERKKEILAKFNANIQDCQDKLFDKRDEYLLRWLIARNFDLVAAEKMLRESLDWRKREGADNIAETWMPPEVFIKYFPFSKLGYDKFGCPVHLSPQGRSDFRGLLQSATKRDYIRYQIWMTERTNREMLEESIRTGKNPWSRITVLCDLEGLSMKQMAYKPTIDVGSEQTKMYDANYPENLRRVFMINAPRLFTLVFKWLKPLLSQVTLDKFRIYGTNKEEWQKALLEEIDADQLPQYYGGTMVDPDGDPKCSSRVNMGGEVPRSYYLTNNLPIAKPYMESMTLPAGTSGVKKLKFVVEQAHSIMRWEFMSEGGDVGFRVYHKHPKDGKMDLVPLHRIESHLVTEEGEIVCESPGEYVICFDNTFSFFKSKKLWYSVAIESPSTVDPSMPTS